MSSAGEMHLSTEAMSAYVDGELGTVAHERAARHIRGCYECAQAVAIQRQAKTSLMQNFGDCDIPNNLLNRLGQIPFATDEQGPLDQSGTTGRRFEFPVASPVGEPRRRGGFGLGTLRGRVFKSSAAAFAVVSVVVSPTLCQQTASDARGHQMHITDVLPAQIDQDPADTSR
ncbi:MAG: anti-sigma factor family protein [Cumulibacter sp.]